MTPRTSLLALLLAACSGSATHTPSPAPAPTAPAPTDAPAPAPSPAPIARDPAAAVLPGDSVGPVTASTTRASLGEAVDASDLRDERIDIGEGVFTAGTIIYGGTDRELRVAWTDDEGSDIDNVRIIGRAWTLPGGLHLGDNLATVEKGLGGPFALYGFGWDYAGTIKLDNTALERFADTLTLRLALAPDATTPESLLGDGTLRSSQSDLVAARPTLDQAMVRL